MRSARTSCAERCGSCTYHEARPMSAGGHRIEVMHGVNLDMLGRRDPEHYGTLTLDELERQIESFAVELGMEARFFRTNSETEYVERLHGLRELVDGAILNPGAWTHYSW